MRIAITGGAGRLGRFVAAEAASHGPIILDLVPPSSGPAEFRRADLLQPDSLIDALRDVEVVLHLGAVDRSVAVDDHATMQVNAIGTWNLFDAARRAGVRRVVHVSSSSVTGLDASNPHMAPLYLPVDEAHALRPSDAYGVSKLCAEAIAAGFARQGMEVIVLRPCFIAFADLQGFMAGEAGPAGRDEPKPLLCAYVGPEDCARAVLAAATVAYSGPKILFLAADDSFAGEQTVPRLEALYGTAIPVHDPNHFARLPHASPVSNAAARTQLGWAPTTRWSGSGLRLA